MSSVREYSIIYVGAKVGAGGGVSSVGGGTIITNGEVHAIDGPEHTGELDHDDLENVTADQHHARDHHARHEPSGADPMAVDAAAGTGSLRTLGTGAAQAAAGNDSRFGASTLTVEETDGTPTDSAVTKIKFPAGTLAISSHEATYTPSASVTEITDIPTAETDASLVLAPDGAGGVEWRTETGGSGSGHFEVLMASGITDPPDPIVSSDGTDWLYGEA